VSLIGVHDFEDLAPLDKRATKSEILTHAVIQINSVHDALASLADKVWEVDLSISLATVTHAATMYHESVQTVSALRDEAFENQHAMARKFNNTIMFKSLGIIVRRLTEALAELQEIDMRVFSTATYAHPPDNLIVWLETACAAIHSFDSSLSQTLDHPGVAQ
jgi:hypothetical protein